jgi:hypothetical protein
MAEEFPLGFAVVGGHRFPIGAVRLREGGITLEIVMKGPLKPFAGALTVFGEDGQGCWQGSMVEVPRIHRGVVWVLAYTLRLDTVRGQEGAVRWG